MNIEHGARKHGVSDEDMIHAERHAIFAVRQEGDRVDRVLKIGPDVAGNMLEIVVVDEYTDAATIIHADRLRDRLRERYLGR